MAVPPETKTEKPSHIKDLFLLFSIPLAIVLLAAAVIYIPQMFAKPAYDFIYSYCEDYQCQDTYSVEGTGIIRRDNLNDLKLNYYNRPASLRYYDADTNATRAITLVDANRYKLDSSSRSPDGYTLSKANSSSGFLFWSESDDNWYLKNGAKKKKVELTTGDKYYSRDVTFLGWVSK